jgi:predicted AAA+ superfamily ATPase
MQKIKRPLDLIAIKQLLELFPVTAILGPRQCGKTTITKEIGPDYFFDLENPRDLAKLENPQLLLEDLEGLIVIDEIQRKPELFTLIRYLVDTNKKQRYLILGSASSELIKKNSENLAGRIGYFEMGGFGLNDIGEKNYRKLWLKGGLPLSYLAGNDSKSILWRENYITTFLEKDIPQLGINIPANTLRKFWIMLSDYHGQIINYSEIGRAFGISDTTVKKYLDILCGTFMVRILQPWHANIGKRLVKNPKIYLRDSGLYHSLLTVQNWPQLSGSAKLGHSWEGFAIEQVIKALKKRSTEVFFWKTHAGAELDLFWQDKGQNWGIEFKYNDAPTATKSMQIAVKDLNLAHLWVIYPGKENYKLTRKISVQSLSSFVTSGKAGGVLA